MTGPITVTFVLLLGVSLVANLWLAIAVRKQRKQLNENAQQLEQLNQMLSGLCSAAVGVDERVVQLEQKGRDLEHRQESYETQKHDSRPYGEAIQLVHQGATVGRLVDELGLSRSEAELVVMLHGMGNTQAI